MLKYRTKYGVEVWIDSKDPNASAKIQYSGNEVMVDVISDRLARQYGAFGHLIGSATTPIDLDAAMKSPEMKEYRPQLIEGEDMVKKYDPKIPKGAIT